VRLTLSDGSTVERDLGDLLRGPLFDPIAATSTYRPLDARPPRIALSRT